ncbi:MAG: exodeoxyribonuclease VII small subunit [Sulfuritalea sp.]|nr:exodeoxyribonuclease VII small subunit [Sulfuritalea sp.]
MATLPNTAPDIDSASASPSFESALSELEGIVAAMEAGQMPLQDALDAYKRGAALLRQCQATLTAAEQQIRILDADGLRDFDAPQEAPLGDPATDGKQEG